jgi:hypothetical protein
VILSPDLPRPLGRGIDKYQPSDFSQITEKFLAKAFCALCFTHHDLKVVAIHD